MPQSRSKYEFIQEASLSQRLAHRMPEYSMYAGTNPNISLTLAVFNVLESFKILDFENTDLKIVRAILNEQRKALFATSERVNEITKMGLQMPKGEDIFSGSAEDVEDE